MQLLDFLNQNSLEPIPLRQRKYLDRNITPIPGKIGGVGQPIQDKGIQSKANSEGTKKLVIDETAAQAEDLQKTIEEVQAGAEDNFGSIERTSPMSIQERLAMANPAPTNKELIGQALITFLPTLLGQAFGGELGGIAGAKAGEGALKYKLKSDAESAKAKKAGILSEYKIRGQLEDKAAEDRYRETDTQLKIADLKLKLGGKLSKDMLDRIEKAEARGDSNELKALIAALAANVSQQNADTGAKKAAKDDEENQGRWIPGWKHDKSVRIIKSEMDNMRDAAGDAEKLEELLSSIGGMVKGAGRFELANPLSDVRKRLDPIVRQAQLLYKGDAFAKLGVLTGPDLELVENVIDNPQSARNLIRGGESAADVYARAAQSVRRSIESTLGKRGFAREDGSMTERLDAPEKSSVQAPPNGLPLEVNRGGARFRWNGSSYVEVQ